MNKEVQELINNFEYDVQPLIDYIERKDKEIEKLNRMLDEKFMKENTFLVENGIICIKNKEIKGLSETLQKIKTIINNEKITGIEAKLMIKDILEEK